MKKLIIILLCMLIFTTTASANSGPIYMDKYPSFNIAPMENCPIEVESEELVFKIDDRVSSKAEVTAQYKMFNPTDEKVTVPMLFPFIYDSCSRSGTAVTVNEKTIDYVVRRVGSVEGIDYLKETRDFKNAVHMNNIIEKLNMPFYEMKNFDDTAPMNAYRIEFSEPYDRELELEFNIDLKKTGIFLYNFNGFKMNDDGKCSASTYISEAEGQNEAYIIILGEDTLTNLTASDNDKIVKTKVILKEFIIDKILKPKKEKYLIYDDIGFEQAYGIVAENIDNLYNDGNRILESSWILEALEYRQNLSAMLYEVDFEPKSTLNLKVCYNTSATIDKEKTEDYRNTFAYILNPAKGWSKFGGLNIEIQLNKHDPYIVESSVELQRQNNNIYRVSFNNLPDDDFVFTTYPKETITFTDKLTAQVLPRSYGAWFIISIASVILAGTIIVIIYRKKK